MTYIVSLKTEGPTTIVYVDAKSFDGAADIVVRNGWSLSEIRAIEIAPGRIIS